jgi:hypothetical protein
MVTDQDVQELIAEMDRGRANWVNGRGEALEGVGQAPDMTLLGPFGGLGPPKGSMTPEQLAAGQAAVSASLFHGGEGHCEVLSTIVEHDVVVLVMIERSMVRFDGFDAPRPWILRTTQVFRKDDAKWIRLHRHADPLIAARSFEETLALLDNV